ncbi:plasma membrane low affinity zinc ion protein [Rutstroemia sp. NJR-2017a BVV2]|nr:plasma membrane low affinity zinc ion protein [Rutstroemia sp. NJR-2017a BVV2]
MLGALLPIAAARTKRMKVPPLAFFITKYFGTYNALSSVVGGGDILSIDRWLTYSNILFDVSTEVERSGVIIATAFIHLLAPATSNLSSPCLTGPITEYDWAAGIALMTIFTMFFVELMASRFDVFGEESHDLEAADPSKSIMRQASPQLSTENSYLEASERSAETLDHNQVSVMEGGPSRPRSSIPGRPDDLSYPPGGEDHLGHQREHVIDDDHFAAQMTAIFILEFGVIFHSIFIGLTLAVTGSEFNVLYIVLVFHQTFEGLGLGSRLATAQWPKSKRWLPWALGSAYGITTPIAIAIGLGVRTTFTPGSQKTMIINGVFDAISAGILIYTGLVELMAHEFMFNPEMRKASMKMMLFAFGCMCLGAGLMALLGKWA